jgi:hypothetical protein
MSRIQIFGEGRVLHLTGMSNNSVNSDSTFIQLQFPVEVLVFLFLYKGQKKRTAKAIPVTGHEGPYGLGHQGSHIFSRQSAHIWQ